MNQARIHTGFHYPRSFATALRSGVLQERFVRDFKHAVFNDFDMLYAIASRRPKISASRFAKMFEGIGAPFTRAPQHLRALFDPALIEDVFVCREFAFDWTALRDDLIRRLDAGRVPVHRNEAVHSARSKQEVQIIGQACDAIGIAQLKPNFTAASMSGFISRTTAIFCGGGSVAS